MSLKGRRILVLEDEPFVRSLVLRMLRDMGGPLVETAANGALGLEALASPGQKFDFALVDFNMPVLSGLDFLKSVRCGRSNARRDLPVAMLTGSSDQSLVGSAMALDVNAFVLKPASPKTLSDRIRRMMSEEAYVQDAAVYDAVEVQPSPLQTPPEANEPLRPASALRPSTPIPPSAPPRIATPQPPTGPRSRKLISDLIAGCVLAEDIVSPKGVRLLSAGTRLNPRLLARIRDLAEVTGTSHVWIHAPVEAA